MVRLAHRRLGATGRPVVALAHGGLHYLNALLRLRFESPPPWWGRVGVGGSGGGVLPPHPNPPPPGGREPEGHSRFEPQQATSMVTGRRATSFLGGLLLQIRFELLAVNLAILVG